MQARMPNPAVVLSDAMQPIQDVNKAIFKGGVDQETLELAEAATRLADRPNPVTDEIWKGAAEHYDERGLAAIVLMIGVTNLFNRLNATTKQVAGAWG